MPADATKACERDLKRFDDLTTRFETAGLVLGFVNLFLAVRDEPQVSKWIRVLAPGLRWLGSTWATPSFTVRLLAS